MLPSFDFDVALEYPKLLRMPWLYVRLGVLLDRHAEKLFFSGKPRDAFLRKLPRGVAISIRCGKIRNDWLTSALIRQSK